MVLNEHNCSNPALYGKDLKLVLNGELVEPINDVIPNEFFFDRAFLGYKFVYGIDNFKKVF